MKSSAFGKTMKNIYNQKDIRSVKNKKKCLKLIMKPNFKNGRKFNENLMWVHMGKTKIKIIKPSMMKAIKFMYFWLNYSEKKNHLKRILVAVKNIKYVLWMTSELLKSDKLHLCLLSDGTQNDGNEYLESLEFTTVSLNAQRMQYHCMHLQRYYIGFPGCFTDKNFMNLLHIILLVMETHSCLFT